MEKLLQANASAQRQGPHSNAGSWFSDHGAQAGLAFQ
ncbi:MAG: hypothetical protein ACI9M6_000601, partial [Hydrogenophaga sp.]